MSLSKFADTSKKKKTPIIKKKNPNRLNRDQLVKLLEQKRILAYVSKIGSKGSEVEYESLALKTKFKNHQEYVRRLINEHRSPKEHGGSGEFGNGDMIFLPPGLGKTLIALDVIVQHIKFWKENAKGILIVLPKSLVNQWCEEFFKHTNIPPELIHLYLCSSKPPQNIQQDKPFIVITTYGIVRNCNPHPPDRKKKKKKAQNNAGASSKKKRKTPIPPFLFVPDTWRVIICDESHLFRTPDTDRQHAIRSLVKANPDSYKLGLTGTPYWNGPNDIRAHGEFFDAHPWSDRLVWKNNLLDQAFMKKFPDKHVTTIRRTEEKNILKLKEMHEQLVGLVMSEKQKKMCKPIQNWIVKQIDAPPRVVKKNSGRIVSAINYLAMICNHPAQIQDLDLREALSNKYGELDPNESTVKISWITDHLPKVLKERPTAKFIIFSRFVTILKIVEPFINKLGITTTHLNGAMSTKERNASIKSFINDPNVTVLLSSIGAGGIGLNLVAADEVIFFEPQWNFCLSEQAKCRIYRIGQTKEVYVTHLMVKNGVDDWIYKIGLKKLEECEKWLDGKYECSDKTQEQTDAFKRWVYGQENEDQDEDLVEVEEGEDPEITANFNTILMSIKRNKDEDEMEEEEEGNFDFENHTQDEENDLEMAEDDTNELYDEEKLLELLEKLDGEENKIKRKASKDDTKTHKRQKMEKEEDEIEDEIEEIDDSPEDVYEVQYEDDDLETLYLDDEEIPFVAENPFPEPPSFVMEMVRLFQGA